MAGVPDSYSWASGPEAVTKFPTNFSAFMAWGQVYEDRQGNPATNSRVQLANLEAWVLRHSTGVWERVQATTAMEGGAFREDFTGNQANPADERAELDGSTSVTAGGGRNYHFWVPGGRASVPSSDISGMVVTVDTRLVLDDERKRDDRGSARYLVGVGADLWLDLFVGHDPPRTIRGLGLGRMIRVTSEWRTATFTTLDGSELQAHPPPLR